LLTVSILERRQRRNSGRQPNCTGWDLANLACEFPEKVMAITSVSCPVARTTVTRVTNFEGETTGVICPEYEEPSGICRLKMSAREGGPLSQLIERLSEDTLDRRSVRCHLK
jgi:hypothetical protein